MGLATKLKLISTVPQDCLKNRTHQPQAGEIAWPGKNLSGNKKDQSKNPSKKKKLDIMTRVYNFSTVQHWERGRRGPDPWVSLVSQLARFNKVLASKRSCLKTNKKRTVSKE